MPIPDMLKVMKEAHNRVEEGFTRISFLSSSDQSGVGLDKIRGEVEEL